jgi:hypothetical protein
MKTLVKFALLAAPALLMFVPELPTQSARLPPGLQFVSEADAQYPVGRSRRTRRRGVAVGYSAGQSAAADSAATQATSAPPAAPAPQQPAPAPQQSAPAAQ